MKVASLQLSLNDLQDALHDYCKKHGFNEADEVIVVSYGKTRISVELTPGGIVTACEFRHRSEAAPAPTPSEDWL